MARQNVNKVAMKQKTLEKRAIKQNADEAEKKMAAMEKAHEIAIRNLKKSARKSQLEFFKIKSEHVMRIFKQEQMHMVEHYYDLKKKEA